MLVVEGLSKTYDHRSVLADFSYVFTPGLIHGIIGPNGAGKSTLLRLLTALEKPCQGRVLYQGQPLLGRHLDFGCVWQRPLMFQRSVFENLAYGLKVRGFKRAQIKNRVADLVEVLQLSGLEKRWAVELSGGEMARVAIARAIAFQPKVLILDEPTANLDPWNTQIVENVLHGLRESGKFTVILVTHDMFQAKRLADYTLYMSGGRLLDSGPTAAFFVCPRSPEARRFVEGKL